MSILKSILYGLVSGLTEFLPVSSRAHQGILRYLFGAGAKAPLQEFLVHIGILVAVYVCCREIISRLLAEQKSINTRRRRVHFIDKKSLYELRLLKTATMPLLLVMLLHIATAKLEGNLPAITVFLIINAVILFIADHSSHGNRDARTMSGLDGIVMGIGGALSVLPGISRTGVIASYTTIRGADSQNVANWAVLLAIPAMLLALCFDFVGIVTVGFSGITFSAFVGYILAGGAAFCGSYAGISLFKMMLNHSGFSGFAYYSLGASLFSFILFLIT